VITYLFLFVTETNVPFLMYLFEKLDHFTSSRLSGALFGLLFFFEESLTHPLILFIGYGNYDAALMFKPYYADLTSMWLPKNDLTWFLEQGSGFSPHNSYIDILISNGAIGLSLMLYVVLFVVLRTRFMALKTNDFLLRWYFAVCFAITVSFFSSDLDFLGGRIILNLFVLAAGAASIRYHMRFRKRYISGHPGVA